MLEKVPKSAKNVVQSFPAPGVLAASEDTIRNYSFGKRSSLYSGCGMGEAVAMGRLRQ